MTSLPLAKIPKWKYLYSVPENPLVCSVLMIKYLVEYINSLSSYILSTKHKLTETTMSLIGILLIGSLSTVSCAIKELSCKASSQNGTQIRCFNDVIGPVTLPTNMSGIIRTLIIEVNSSSSFYIGNEHIFRNFYSLRHLEIRAKAWTFNWNSYLTYLFNLTNLETLIIEDADFSSYLHSWRLPSGLNKLVMKNCKYTKFNLSCCPYLNHVDFSGNPLIEIPTFAKCPNLGELILKNSPLIEFSVNDIASICAKNLELDLQYYSMGSRERRCECKRLLEWSQAHPKSKVKCNITASSLDNCEEYTLDDATNIEKQCLQECKAT